MASLRWYARRLQSMSGAEVAHRVGQVAIALGEQARLISGGAWPDDEALRNQLQGPRRVSHLRPSDSRRTAFLASWPDEVTALRDRATAAAHGKVEIFGEWLDLGPEPSWHRDPKTGREWPADAFYGRIDIRGGGAKGIWEPARHQHLIALAQSAWLEDTPAAIEALEAQLSRWMRQNTWRRGVHWCSGLEMAIRLASWTWIDALIGERLSANLWREWTREVVQYGDHLERHLSLHSSANNHLIGEAAGLVLAANFVPEWKDANRWRTLGRGILVREIALQIHDDGTPAEQAFHYLGFILDFYFLILRVSPDLIDHGLVRERIAAAGAFISSIGNSAVDLPMVGDDDGGAACRLSSAHASWRSRLALAAAWTGQGALKSRGGRLEPAAWWLMSDERLNAWHALPSTPSSPGSAWLKTGGYAALRTGNSPEQLAVFDCGPLGYLSIAAHGHADCLSVCLSLNGRWVLVDPGTFVYHEQPEWRSHFRGTCSHNTMTVGGADQSVQTGHTMWGPRATARWVAFEERPGFRWAEGEHDGYLRLATPCRHQRVVGLSDGEYLVVIDWLSVASSRTGAHAAVPCLWRFQCAPGHDLTWTVLHQATMRTVEGWVSPHFGVRISAPAIELEAEGQPDMPYVTVIGFGSDSPKATLAAAGAEWLLTVSHTRGTDALTLRTPEAAGTGSTIRSAAIHP